MAPLIYGAELFRRLEIRARSYAGRPKSVQGILAKTKTMTRDQIDGTFHGIMARSFGMSLATA